MFKKFLESFTLKDIIFIGIILILFLKMNKMKEKFSNTFTDQTDFETKVKDVLGDNVQAIKNLGDLSKKILDTPSGGTLDLSNINLKVKSSTVSGNLTVSGTLEKLNKSLKNGKIYGGRGSKTPTNFCKEKNLRLCSAKEVESAGGACQYAHYGSGNTAGYYYAHETIAGACNKGWNGGDGNMYNDVWCCANDPF